jgi:hypothetical protein
VAGSHFELPRTRQTSGDGLLERLAFVEVEPPAIPNALLLGLAIEKAIIELETSCTEVTKPLVGQQALFDDGS